MKKAVCLFLVCIIFVDVFCGETIYNNKQGTIDGLNYELWKDYGTTSMTLNGGGKFSCSWSSINNALFRIGKKFGSTKKYTEYGAIVVDYEADYKPNGNSYLCVYGWTQGPLVEYYIVESWGSWRPPGATSTKGVITVNGGKYDVYETTRVNQPSIEGDTTFQQYWSVRQEKRSKGQIYVHEHFAQWEKLGLPAGKLYEAALNVEGYQSSGSANILKNDISVGGSTSSSGSSSSGSSSSGSSSSGSSWGGNTSSGSSSGGSTAAASGFKKNQWVQEGSYTFKDNGNGAFSLSWSGKGWFRYGKELGGKSAKSLNLEYNINGYSMSGSGNTNVRAYVIVNAETVNGNGYPVTALSIVPYWKYWKPSIEDPDYSYDISVDGNTFSVYTKSYTKGDNTWANDKQEDYLQQMLVVLKNAKYGDSATTVGGNIPIGKVVSALQSAGAWIGSSARSAFLEFDNWGGSGSATVTKNNIY